MKKFSVMAIAALALVSVSGTFASQSQVNVNDVVASDSTVVTDTVAPAQPAPTAQPADTTAVAN